MIRITRDQAMALAEKGFKWNEEISHTTGHHKSYYLIETKKALAALASLENKEVSK